MNTFAVVSLLALSVLVGTAYTLLGLRAKAHLTAEASESVRSIGWLYWWSCSPSLYDDEGKRLCRKGNLLVVPLLALFVAWYAVLLR